MKTISSLMECLKTCGLIFQFQVMHYHLTHRPDKVEAERLKSTQVLIKEELYEGDPVTAKLTTEHGHDWRLKPYGDVKKGLQ